MINLSMFESEPERYIWMAGDTIVIESRFAREFEGNLEKLISCCEDAIYVGNPLVEDFEKENIFYNQAISDYKKELEVKRRINSGGYAKGINGHRKEESLHWSYYPIVKN